MFGTKRVTDYHSEREKRVLGMVKQYPLYSLNKLAQLLPDISRHSLQNILEKHDLSTIEKRMFFGETNKKLIFKILGFIKYDYLSFFKSLKVNLSGRQRLILLVFSLTGIFLFSVVSIVFANAPEIYLEKLNDQNVINMGEKLFISGKVVPKNAKVMINGKGVALNGNGSFTAIVNLPMGESELQIEAFNFTKQAKLVRLVNRVPTEGELQTIKQEEADNKKKAIDKSAELDRTVNDLLAAKNVGGKGELKIYNNHLQENAGFTQIVGEVANLGKVPARWVTITAIFYNQAGVVIDTKYGFAVGMDKVINPDETVSFETQATTKPFDRYTLDLTWEPVGAVGGVATKSSELN